LQGRVACIVNGDTLVVLNAAKTQHKIRFAGSTVRKRVSYGATG